jgi:hypothetical protein
MRLARTLSSKNVIAAVNFSCAIRLAANGFLGDIHDIEIQTRSCTPWRLWSLLAIAPGLDIRYCSIHYFDRNGRRPHGKN